jgi:hypothetical protein
VSVTVEVFATPNLDNSIWCDVNRRKVTAKFAIAEKNEVLGTHRASKIVKTTTTRNKTKTKTQHKTTVRQQSHPHKQLGTAANTKDYTTTMPSTGE